MFVLFARLLYNKRSEKIPAVARSTPKALYVSMILAALEEMVGNEQNVRHGRIDSELQKPAASISGSPFENSFFNHHQHSTIFICTFHSLAVS